LLRSWLNAIQVGLVLASVASHCELLIHEDEGHGLAKLESSTDAYPKLAAFLQDVLDCSVLSCLACTRCSPRPRARCRLMTHR